MNIRFVLASIILCVFTHVGYAFDVDGFSAGMSKSKAESIIKTWNFDTVDNKLDTLCGYDNPNKSNARLYCVSFISNKLVSVQKAFKPNIKNFIMLYDKFKNIYGEPIMSDSGSNILSIGETKYITFIWQDRVEKVELNYTIFESNDTLHVIYRVTTVRLRTE